METFEDYRREMLPLIAREDGSLDNFVFEPHSAFEYEPGEHTHCNLCWATISNLDNSKYLKEGLRCCETGSWVCPRCFNDFRAEFNWKLCE